MPASSSTQATDVAPASAQRRALPTWAARIGWLDLALVALGTGMGWMSLWFPFGRDQGLYFYVAREWVERGAIPYKDVLDHKTPGIYIVHALAVQLFGETMWGIRLLELAAVLATGWLAATFTVPRGQAPLPGVRGGAVLGANVLFYGILGFWDLSQSEVWYSLLGLATMWAARRIEHESRATFTAGVFAGAALIMKPPAIWFVLLAVLIMGLRTLEVREQLTRRLVKAVGLFAAGAALVVVPVLGYFALKGALPAMYEIVVRSNAYYAKHETDVNSLDIFISRVLEFCRIYSFLFVTIASSLLLATGMALGRGDRTLRDRHLLALVLAACGFAAVVMQMKFYLLHWVALLGPASVICANLAADCRELLGRMRDRRAAPLAFAALLLAAWWLSPGAGVWFDENRLVLSYLRGAIPREEFCRYFQIPVLGFNYEESEKVGTWLREHSWPNETIAVRGFQPEIYAVAQRRYPGRFFWTTFLTSPTRGEPELSARWRDEDVRTLDATPPRYVVTLNPIHEGPDSAEWFTPRGYSLRQTFTSFSILERDRPAAAPLPQR